MIRVIVADDHDLVRQGIVKMLEDEPDIEVVGHVSSGEDAVRLSCELNPDVVLMDLKMPGIGGHQSAGRAPSGDKDHRGNRLWRRAVSNQVF